MSRGSRRNTAGCGGSPPPTGWRSRPACSNWRALDPALPDDARLEDAAAKALATLAARRGDAPFLLVYDNVPSPELLDGLVPPRGAAVLVTSRAPDWSGVAQEVFVDTLPEDAAVDFLLRRAGRQDADAARRLAVALGCLPLALDHAGAYVRRAGIGFDAYAQRVADRIQTAPPRGAAYPRSVAATFALAIEKAAREAPAAETLLGLFAWFAPEAIPLVLADETVMPEAEREAAVIALRTVSLLAPAPDGACGPAVSVHRLVQAVMRARLAATGTSSAALSQAVARLAAMFPYGYRDAAVWPLCRELLPHQRALVTHIAPGEDTSDVANLLNRAGCFAEGNGDAAGALPLYRRALDSCERVLGKEHPATLISVGNLAGCLRALGDAAGALPLFRRALDSFERVLGKEHPATLSSVNNLAGCMLALGDAAGALPLARRTLDSRERVLGKEHPDTLQSVNNLAGFTWVLGDAAGALPLFRRALDSRERVLGKEHPETLQSVLNLAGCMRALGDAAGALPLFRRALDSRERVLGKEHPDTLQSMNNLAGCLYALGDAAGALPRFRRAADGFERLLGPDHPSSRTVRANYQRCEREVAAARHGPTPGGHASRTESQQTAAAWWRRLLR